MCARPPTILALLGIALSSQACKEPGELQAGRGGERRELALTSATTLHDSAGALLAQPNLISEDRAGRIVVTDFSDRNVKIYDASGALVGRIGRAGQGPGEFSTLMAAQVFRDSLLAYDAAGGRLSVFGPDGRFARSRPLRTAQRSAPFSIRVIDDSLLLLVSGLPTRNTRAMLSLVRPDGSTRSRFLDLGTYLGANPQVTSAVGLLADGFSGRIFATVAGGDSVWVFDYDGHRLGAFEADPVQPLVTVRSLVEANGGKRRRPQGGSVVDGNRMVVSLVAMDSGTVALQIAAYDSRLGIDPEDGGTFVVSTLAGGSARMLTRQEMVGALLGRDRRGRLLILRYASPEAESHELLRASLAAAGASR